MSISYQCKECKKVIAKSNPKTPAGDTSVSLIQASSKHGFRFSYPSGFCPLCEKPYDIKPEDLMDTTELTQVEKMAKGKEIAKEVKEAEAKTVEESDTKPKVSLQNIKRNKKI